MTDAERIWSEKSDDDLLEAAGELSTYTEEGQRVIRAELRRRALEDPVEQARFAVADPAAELPEDEDDDRAAAGGLQCVRCRFDLIYLGQKNFHEGTHWGALGELGHLFEKSESFDMYACPKCGHVEMFIDGVGEDGRPN